MATRRMGPGPWHNCAAGETSSALGGRYVQADGISSVVLGGEYTYSDADQDTEIGPDI